MKNDTNIRYWMVTPDLRSSVLTTLYQFGHEKCAKDKRFGPSKRDFYLLHFVTKGQGRFITNGECYDLSGGDVFLIRPGEETFYESDDKNPYEYYWIGFNGLKCNEFLSAMGFIDGNPVKHPKNFAKIEPILKNMYVKEKELNIKQYAEAYRSMYFVFSLLIEGDKKYRSALTQDDFAKRTVNYIEENYSYDMPMQAIAKAASISTSQLYRIFKKKYGVSPNEFIRGYRLDKAVNMVLQTNMSIKEIAYSCGFDSASYFIHSYKNKFGFTPKQNRRIEKELQEENVK